MNRPSNTSPRSAPSKLAWLLVTCIIFLQMGFTYYWSFQTLAVFIVLLVVFKSRPAFVNLGFILLIMFVFTALLALTAFTVPMAISENSVNLFNTFVGVVGYAFIIVSLPNLTFRSPEIVLKFFRTVSTLTILITVALMGVTDLGFLPVLTRQTLILQNTTLITNYTTLDVLEADFSYLDSAGLQPNLDLFYGEQSFLAMVLFSSVVSRLVCDRLLDRLGRAAFLPVVERTSIRFDALIANYNQAIVIGLGLAAMIYIKSFSSFFYTLAVCVTMMISALERKAGVKINQRTLILVLLALTMLGGVAIYAADYYTHRLSTVSDSVSFDQRFASAKDFGLMEFIIGIGDAAKMPTVGFQNGILYIIAISGMGGIGLMAFLFYRICILARPLGLSVVIVVCVFGAFSQSGGILSPNKIVILSLVLLPLACGAYARDRRCLTMASSTAHG